MTTSSSRMRSLARAPGVMLLLSAVGLIACVTRPVDSLPPENSAQVRAQFPARPNDQVDILFVIDDSGSMAQEQQNLGTQFKTFVQNLRDANGQPFDYRIAVASTDVGVGGVQVDPFGGACNNPDRGDAVDQYKGILQTTIHSALTDWDGSSTGQFACGDPVMGQDPGDQQLCDQLASNRSWLESNCAGLTLTADKPFIGNDKTLNRTDDDVAKDFRCIGSLGINGCFIEQPLEAARAALDKNRTTFLRDQAYLAVIFITDETECSAKDVGLFDPNASGFKTDDPGFRCYVDAVDCTGDAVNTVAVPSGGGNTTDVTFTSYTSCTDNPRWLTPVDEYTTFLKTDIKGAAGADRVIVAGIMGNTDYTQAPEVANGGPGARGADVQFVWEGYEINGIPFANQSASCASVNGNAAPAPRIQRLLNEFPDPTTGQPNFVSICQADFGPALQQLAISISNKLTTICVDIPADALESNPNQVCVLDELGPGGVVRNGAIPAVAEGTGTTQWNITAGSANCQDAPTDPALARVEITIDPTFRDTTFEIDSTIAVTCAQ